LIEERKQAVSMRLSAGDIHRIKGLAHRLGVRGRSPVPPPAARVPEVVRDFGFDATTLPEIVNSDASPELCAALVDITRLTKVSAGVLSEAELACAGAIVAPAGHASGAIRRESAQGGYRAWRCACRGTCEAQGHELA